MAASSSSTQYNRAPPTVPTASLLRASQGEAPRIHPPLPAARSPAPALREDRAPWPEPVIPTEPTPADELAYALLALDLDALTARDALQWLWEYQDLLRQ